MGIDHAQIYSLTKALVKEQGLTEAKIIKLDNENPPPIYKKRTYEISNRYLEAVLADYDNRERIDFVRACAYHFSI
jgi:hypothetical protein